MIHEYEKNIEQDKVVLPISCVRDNGFDPETFLEASGMQWDSCFALKSFGMVFSVFTFFTKIVKFLFSFGRSFQVLGIRSSFWLMYGMD